MNTETEAAFLRRAAELIRSRGATATFGLWWAEWGHGRDGKDHIDFVTAGDDYVIVYPYGFPMDNADNDAQWVATLNPSIATPLAALLNREAKSANRRHPSDPNPALELARVLLGETT